MRERDARRDFDPATIRRLLQGPKPGLAAQARMAPRPRPGWPPEEEISPREGGVLVLLYPRNAETHLVLTLRTETLADHRGQIALPGGRREEGETVVQTALREAWEEVGVSADRVEVLGTLTPLYIPPSEFCVTPVVGWATTRPRWRPNAVEVAQVLEVPLRRLLHPAARREKAKRRDGTTVQIPYFLVQGHHVWGATAMILGEFLEILRSGDPSR
jgi:8-oxo-dGTP pyrophosphatase MutT (NUDIX family)